MKLHSSAKLLGPALGGFVLVGRRDDRREPQTERRLSSDVWRKTKNPQI